MTDLIAKYGPCPCPINQLPQEFAWLLDKYVELKPKRVLEIGVEKGGTLWYFARWAEPNALVIGVDINLNQRAVTYEQFDALRRGIELKFLEEDSNKPLALDRVRAYLAGEKLDFLFIDGGHGFDVVSSDFCAFGPLVRKGGLIAVHDIHLGNDQIHLNWGVAKFWDKVKKAGYKTDEIQLLSPGSAASFGIGVVTV